METEQEFKSIKAQQAQMCSADGGLTLVAAGQQKDVGHFSVVGIGMILTTMLEGDPGTLDPRDEPTLPGEVNCCRRQGGHLGQRDFD